MSNLRVTVDNVWSHLDDWPEEPFAILDNAFAPFVPNAEWIERNHYNNHRLRPDKKCALCRGGWDLRRHFVTERGNLPTGLLVDAGMVMARHGYVIELRDQRKRPVGSPWGHRVTLRDDQVPLVDEFLRVGQGCIEAATGFGKTIVDLVIAARLGVPTLLVVPTQALIANHRDKFIELGEAPVSCWKGPPPWQIAPVNISTLALLATHRAKLREATADIGLLIVDEAHHLQSAQWYNTLMRVPAYYRLGQSAKAFDDEAVTDLKLKACCGPILARVTGGEMTERGLLEQTTVKFINWHSGRRVMGDVYREGIVEDRVRNAYFVAVGKACYDLGLQCLILCAWLDHMDLLYEQIAVDGRDRVIVAHGQQRGMTAKQLHAQLDALRSGEALVCVSTTVFDEGIDVPNLPVLAMAGGHKRDRRTIQRLGRVRRKGEFGRALVFDAWDTTHKQLLNHSMERRAQYEAEGCAIEDIRVPIDKISTEIEEFFREANGDE